MTFSLFLRELGSGLSALDSLTLILFRLHHDHLYIMCAARIRNK